jgi:hypothetical protein
LYPSSRDPKAQRSAKRSRLRWAGCDTSTTAATSRIAAPADV